MMFSNEKVALHTLAHSMVFSVLVFGLASCGGSGGSGGGGGGLSPSGTQIAVTFSGATPLAVANQIGSGSWTTASLQSGEVDFLVPEGTATYSLAYVCPTAQGMGPINNEVVIQATTQDATSYTLTCPSNPASTGTASGTVDASAIPGAASVQVFGDLGYGTSVTGISGAFSATMPSGTNDIAAVAYDSSNNLLAVKILPAQTVPLSGASIVFAAADEVSTEPITITGIPAGFNTTPAVSASYVTVNGTSFSVSNSAGTQYAVVAASDAQSGDYYSYSANDADVPTNQSIYVLQTTSTAAAVALALPAPMIYAAPTPAAFPSFNVAYSGFSGSASVADSAEIEWFNPSNTLNTLTVFATSAFQNGATTISIPDLTSVTGFLPTAASGSTVYWRASVVGGSYQSFLSTPSNASLASVITSNTFTEP